MRKISAIFFTIICLAALLFSYSTWKEKIQAAGGQNAQPANAETQKNATEAAIEESLPSLDVAALAANMDSNVRTVFLDRSKAGEKLQVLVVGSQSMDSGEPGYAELFLNDLADAYPDFVEADSMSFDGTSAAFLQEEVDLTVGYDVVVFEPFTLNNNGIVEIESEHEHIQEFAGRLRAEVADAALVLHPPQPIYGAQFYLTQVKGLEEFALRQNYGYINHWTAWPETTDIGLKDYLTEDGSPAQRGAEAWASELNTYFIAN
ncbi:hypothetical protein HNQ44_000818 [Planomicrobium koreense]|uniref:SGNH/GDSL hydrolase family protein n=2 Tax=Planococcus koreensis TaxID=112331 RepID=A0A7W8FRD5_9BACL|nr:SGNH/GDSL hydrolase family protein [Planococcus koreensis]MBB5179394.1 hypothetical protein [Planococcus koreensis]